MKLEQLGWNEFFAGHFRNLQGEGYAAGRVYLEHRGGFWLYTEKGETEAVASGKLLHRAEERGERPAVGDWTAIRFRENEGKAVIHHVLPRKSKFSRKSAGHSAEEQIIATNIDTAMLVAGLDHDYNLRRLERYLTMVAASGAAPVVVLNKIDLAEDVEAKIDEVERLAAGVPVVAVSAARAEGIDRLAAFIKTGETIALLGSSGAGKSTITNRLIGSERQSIGEVREDDSRGRHTTTRRELIVLPGGGLIVDTPGMRELQLWVGDEALQQSFADVEALAAQCRFSDCDHRATPGCAVLAALDDASLDPQRWANFNKLQRELEHLRERHDARAQRAKKQRVKKIVREFQKIKKRRF